jgi:hypothetical protein
MNILILCIFNETNRNKQLIQIQRDNFVNNYSIDYYFITYDENLTEEFKLINDTLFIKGNENYMNILDKTIKALRYFINIKDYDFIIRTNISTAFNYKLLYNYLNEIPKNNIYLGGIVFNLNWIDVKYGITNENIEKYLLKGLKFFQGTCIILSSDVAKNIIENSDKLIYDVVDDVSIGLFIKTYLPNSYLSYINMPKISKISKISEETNIYENNSVLYRHRCFNDDEDIKNMINTFKIINNNNTI